METKYKILIGLVIIGLAFGTGRFSKPAQIKTEVKEVVKTVTVKEEAKTKIIYKDRIVSPDGTITEHETTTEASQSSEHTASEASKTAISETKRDTGLTLSALAIANISDLKGNTEYGIGLSKRIIGNLGISGIVTSDKKIGVGLSLSF